MTTQPKLWKKTLATTMALTMLAGAGTAVVASANDKTKQNNGNHYGQIKRDIRLNLNFEDLSEKEWKWAYQHIIRLASKGVFSGYEDGSFKPQKSISRVEAIVAAVRFLGLQAEAEKPENMNATLNFKDFNEFKKKNPWAVGYITVALENDLFSETATTIDGNKPADRLWAAILLVKALKLEDQAKAKMDTQLSFRDAGLIPAGAVGYVAVAVEKKWIAGYPDETFRPNKPITRAELASILDTVDQQNPDENSAQAITGTIQSIANGSIVVKKADNTTVTVALDANVFIFRNNVKSPVSALVAGDEALIRTYENKAVFIEVTKIATPVVQLNDAGNVTTFTLNAEGKIATLSLTRTVNGVSQTVVYNVDPNVTVTGGSGVLAPNLNVVVKGENNVVKSIEIQH